MYLFSGARERCVFVFLCFCARKIASGHPHASAYNRLRRFFLVVFFLTDLSYVGFVLVGDVLDIQR